MYRVRLINENLQTHQPTSELEYYLFHSIMCVLLTCHIPLFLHSPVKKHLNCIPFFDITMNAAVNTIYIFHGACV